ncbi:L-lactate dehydrogenase [Caproiciproducens faecalis]|uniref:L-lactate dehydrogenase n=1 Tax=Caproiciproducens faecalis TaxID=2820301 RepID=A0ABS7DKD5_9FIRM|nr:L-lactate dehydrogenase [Caproiciproducens faecalis]MBW7571762.1 L-lactate dehydrogenase [Caproiciproducens faecalis]
MIINKSKVVIVGAGAVGSSTAFSLVTQGICDDVVLTDINQGKAVGEAMDLRHCIEYLNRNVRVSAGTYEDCGDADIVVITASAPYVPGQNRLDMLGTTKKIIDSMVGPIMKSGFDGIFIVISNPVDIISYYIYQLSGLPKNQVIGTGTALDTARLKCLIAQKIDVDPRSVHCTVMGEHGDSQMVPWSRVTVGGKDFFNIVADNQDRLKGADLKQMVHETANAGWEILHRKGNTNYGIATTTAGIIKTILYNESRIIPVSTLLCGEYGENGVFAGVPAVLGRNGVKEVVEVRMTDEELLTFKKSVAVIREFSSQL